MGVRKGIWKRVRKGGLERGFGSGYGRWVWKGVKKGGSQMRVQKEVRGLSQGGSFMWFMRGY